MSDRPDDVTAGDAEFFEMSLDCLCVAGFDGYWKRLNPAWSRTLGWTREEMMAVPLIEFVHPDDRAGVLAARDHLYDGVPLRTLANRYRRKDGTYCWFEWRSVADPERGVVYCVARDVTADKEAQQALAEARAAHDRLQRQLMVADRLASVGTLAAGVAHEINNPLAYVMANLELLAEDVRALGGDALGDRAAEWSAMLRETLEGAERIRKIVRGLKTFSRTEDERRTVLEIMPVLELAIELASNEIRHRARLFKVYGPGPLVKADESRLGQVFTNLLVNAAHALPDRDADRHEIRVVTLTDAAGNAVIEVHDTGTGIPDDALGRIFDPFFTTKPFGTGTGLGLAICHKLVTDLGGHIAAANRPEGGAVLRVVLPPAGTTPSRPAGAGARDASTGKRRVAVLVIDDEPSVGASLTRLLREHDVTGVTSARQALELVRAGRWFDMILTDLMMPEMSGIELFEELVRHDPAIAPRIVFMTGGAFTAAAHAFLDRVPNERLEKPFGSAAIRELVARFARL